MLVLRAVSQSRQGNCSIITARDRTRSGNVLASIAGVQQDTPKAEFGIGLS